MMTTPHEALKTAMRDIVSPYLRSEGFRGSGRTRRRYAANGDAAIVDVQTSSWSTPEEVFCQVNLAVVPAPWWRWVQGPGRGARARPEEQHGLYRTALHPAPTDGTRHQWWHVSDLATAERSADEMVRQLRTVGVPTLVRLLDRGAMLHTLRLGDLGHFRGEEHRPFFDRAMAVLLADEGPSAELEFLLDRIDDTAQGHHRPSALALIAYVQRQAAGAA